VKANDGTAGVDNESINAFASKLSDNLYRLWNRIGSGSYFFPPLTAVGLRGSMSALANPYDNAQVESFMQTLKVELRSVAVR